jgi:hypothetical protein
MENVYVWTVIQTGPFESSDINSMTWKCEKITSDGSITESTGEVSLSSSVSVDDFKDYSHEQVNELLFQNIDKSAIEAEL